ncbi:MAG: ABC transporter permease [Treponema sp.]|nr:ABC transporter permease [Treponema sp.]
MKTIKNPIASLRWILMVSKRFARVDRKGRSAATSVLATLGIGFGVMALIVVMSIMNGFQMSFIDSILEISSYHLRVENLESSQTADFLQVCQDNNKISCVSPFYEAQALMTGNKGGESAVIIRAIDSQAYYEDPGFRKELRMIAGQFDVSKKDSIIIGSSLANHLGLGLGDSLDLLVMSGGSDVALFSDDRVFTVTGIFSSGYREINASYCFVNFQAASAYFGKDSKLVWGLKIKNYNHDALIRSHLEKAFPNAKISAWRDYNKNFFGVLRLEKNLLLFIVALIFVVVGINIYNGMRRLVYERKNEIAILSALGVSSGQVKAVFIMKGLLMGLVGSIFGLLLGLLISFNTDIVFKLMSDILYFFQYIFTAITSPENLDYVQMNSSYTLYANIPARIFGGEVLGITLFGILSPFIAAWSASKNVLKMSVSEVLHNE